MRDWRRLTARMSWTSRRWRRTRACEGAFRYCARQGDVFGTFAGFAAGFAPWLQLVRYCGPLCDRRCKIPSLRTSLVLPWTGRAQCGCVTTATAPSRPTTAQVAWGGSSSPELEVQEEHCFSVCPRCRCVSTCLLSHPVAHWAAEREPHWQAAPWALL